MNTHADQTKENKSQAVSNALSQKESDGVSAFQFVDNRPEAVAQRKLQEIANNSSRVNQLKAYRDVANNGTIQMMYRNRMEESFKGEVKEANTAAVESDYENGPGPYVGGTDGFNAFINSGKMFKWIYGEKNGIVIISPTLKHAVAAGAADVITAGHGQLNGEGQIWINNDTGHYQTSLESLGLSLGAWEQLGYNPEIRERVDFAAALAGLGGGGGREKLFGIV